MTIGPGAQEKEVSAAAASTTASVPPSPPPVAHRAHVGTKPAQDRDERVWSPRRSSVNLDAVLDHVLRLLVPAVCLACRGAPAVSGGDPLCHGCRVALPWLTGGSRCGRCGLPEVHARTACPARAQAFDAAYAPLAYAGAVPALVVALKERGAVGLARMMAAQIAATAPPGTWDAAALVPVPADPLRRRRRGVDHAARLAAELAPRCGLPVAPVLARAPALRSARQAGGWRPQGRAPTAPAPPPPGRA